MLAPIIHILPITRIRRERVLPIPGRVLVRQGQEVSPRDIIVEANLNPEHLVLDVGRILKVPSDIADQHLQCREGDSISKGDIIAGPVGVARRILRSPRNGVVVLSGGGQVLLDITTDMVELKAGLPGEVVELIADRGAVVETSGALIQGVWGNGKLDFGVMTILAKTPDHVLTSDQIEISLRGSIVIAGFCNDPECITTAGDLPLRGLILSSMSPALIPVAKNLQIPVLVIEGFGERPMNSAAFKLLTTNERRDIAINAEKWDRKLGKRPEIVIPLPASGRIDIPLEADYFAPDQKVRILRAPHAGEIGTVVKLLDKYTFPSGIRAPAAAVRLQGEEQINLPLANLEVLA